MKIIRKSGNLDGATVYRMTKDASVGKMSDAAGMVLRIKEFVIYEDEKTDKNGNPTVTTICSIMAEDGLCYATNSPTFCRDFSDMIDMFADFGDQVHSILVLQKQSKAGRTFITASYND